MNQEITYSSKLIEYLHSDNTILEISNQKKVWELIKQNYVVSDTNMKILEDYGAIVKNLPTSTIKQELQNFVDGLIQNKAHKRKTFDIIELNEELEIGLSKSTNDKIYFNPLLNEKEIRSVVKKYSDLESHSELSFLNPEPIHRLKHLPTIINMEDGCYYDINKIFNPFLREAKNIRIEDPYLPNTKASANLWKLLCGMENTRIKLVFLMRSKYAKNNNSDLVERYDSFMSSIQYHISKGFLLDYSEPFLKKSHRERWIFTDQFQIYVPGGLDFLSEDGFFMKDPNYTQDVEYRNQIRIEKRNFEVRF